MKPVFFLIFLMAVSAFSASVNTATQPLSVVMEAADTNIAYGRVYQYCDKQGEAHRINVACNKPHHNVGEFVMQDLAAQRELLITMEFGDGQRDTLRTQLAYKGCAREEEAMVFVWAEESVKSEGLRRRKTRRCIKKEGVKSKMRHLIQTRRWIKIHERCVQIDAPAWAHACDPAGIDDRPVCWSTPIHPQSAHCPKPVNYVNIDADEQGAKITQFFWKDIFVRMCVQYEKLDEVKIFFGIKGSGCAAHLCMEEGPGDGIIVKF